MASDGASGREDAREGEEDRARREWVQRGWGRRDNTGGGIVIDGWCPRPVAGQEAVGAANPGWGRLEAWADWIS